MIKMQIAVLTLGKEWWFCSCPYIGVGDVVKLERPAKTMHAWPKQPKREDKKCAQHEVAYLRSLRSFELRRTQSAHVKAHGYSQEDIF